MRTGPAGAGPVRGDALRDGRDGPRRGRLGIAREDRLAAVAALAQRRLERHLAEQRHAELLRQRLATALAEGIRGLPAAGAGEARHVLDHAQQRLAELLDHLRRPRGHALRGELRRRDEHGLGARQQLPEREPDVAGSRRHVDQQVVERAPVDVGEELLERAMQHRSAPHDRAAVVEEEPDGHDLQVVRDRRHDHLVHDHRPLLDAEHARNRVAVDVGVDDADLEPAGAQRERQVDRQRRLADAALAGRDGDHPRALLDCDLALSLGSGRRAVARATQRAAPRPCA